MVAGSRARQPDNGVWVNSNNLYWQYTAPCQEREGVPALSKGRLSTNIPQKKEPEASMPPASFQRWFFEREVIVCETLLT